jgi:hypothetical protein
MIGRMFEAMSFILYLFSVKDVPAMALTPSGPANGYVLEDGVTFYVAEDGATNYVQES